MIKHWLRYETLLAFRQPQQIWLSVLFFLLVALIFPMLIPYQSTQIHGYGAEAIIWITITLSCLSTHHYLFSQDEEQGVLTQIYLSQTPLGSYVIAKSLVYWLKFVVPLILSTPILSIWYQMNMQATCWLMISLTLATPSLVLMCSLMSALLLGQKQPQLILFLLILPLVIPELIFGRGVLQAWYAHESVRDPVCLLVAVLLLTLGLMPLATVYALKFNLNKRQ
jgi:heme exporter protein B